MPGKTDPFDNLIFEVNCLGCGHVAFSLPYREGTHHTMTCHRCGEVTIAHVLDGGHVAVATFVQRAAALERIMSDVESVLSNWDAVVEEQDVRGEYRQRIPLPRRGFVQLADTLHFTATSETARLGCRDAIGVLGTVEGILEASASVRLRPEGLLLRLTSSGLTYRAVREELVDRSSIGGTVPGFASCVANFDGTLLVEPRVPPPSPKDTTAT